MWIIKFKLFTRVLILITLQPNASQGSVDLSSLPRGSSVEVACKEIFFKKYRLWYEMSRLSSTVVCGLSCTSPRKASIKEFHQFAMLTVTIPLDMAVIVRITYFKVLINYTFNITREISPRPL